MSSLNQTSVVDLLVVLLWKVAVRWQANLHMCPDVRIIHWSDLHDVTVTFVCLYDMDKVFKRFLIVKLFLQQLNKYADCCRSPPIAVSRKLKAKAIWMNNYFCYLYSSHFYILEEISRRHSHESKDILFTCLYKHASCFWVLNFVYWCVYFLLIMWNKVVPSVYCLVSKNL